MMRHCVLLLLAVTSLQQAGSASAARSHPKGHTKGQGHGVSESDSPAALADLNNTAKPLNVDTVRTYHRQ